MRWREVSAPVSHLPGGPSQLTSLPEAPMVPGMWGSGFWRWSQSHLTPVSEGGPVPTGAEPLAMNLLG